MALQTTGAITLANIQTEFGGANPISLSEYYAGGTYVPAGTSGTNGAVPSSGAISLSNFYGTTAYTGIWAVLQNFSTSGNREYGEAVTNYSTGQNRFLQTGFVTDNTTTQYYIQKFDKDGNIVTYKNINVGVNSIDQADAYYDATGGGIVSDIVTNGVGPGKFAYLTRFNDTGSILWCIKISWTSGSFLTSGVGVMARGYGKTALFNGSNPEYYGYRSAAILTVNDSGSGSTATPTLKWARVIRSIGAKHVDGLCLGWDGNYNLGVAGRDGSDIYLANATLYSITSTYSGGGTLSWARALDYTSVTDARALYWDSISKGGNSWYLCGRYSIGQYGTPNAMIAKYSNAGVLQWQRAVTAASNNNNYIYSETIVSDSASTESVYVVLSALNSSSSVVSTFYQTKTIILKYNSSGVLQWQRSLTVPTSGTNKFRIQLRDIAVIESENRIVLTGSINRSASSTSTVDDWYDVVTIKLPVDGSHTGSFTVGSWTIAYEASSYVEAAAAFVDIDWASSTSISDPTTFMTFTSYTPTTANISRVNYTKGF